MKCENIICMKFFLLFLIFFLLKKRRNNQLHTYQEIMSPIGSSEDELCLNQVISAEITNIILGQVRIQNVTLQDNEMAYGKNIVLVIIHHHIA